MDADEDGTGLVTRSAATAGEGVVRPPCTACGAVPQADDRFCEECGSSLGSTGSPADGTPSAEPPSPSLPLRSTIPSTTSSNPTCPSCGATGLDGWCEECGRRLPTAPDRVEDALAPEPGGPHAAGVSDRGHVRRRNEDSFRLARATMTDGTPAVVVVVADGVASAPHGDTASRVACEVATAAGVAALDAGGDAEAASDRAVTAAADAVGDLARELDGGPGGGPPACTYVAATVVGDTAVVSWLGDSRAYLLVPGGESQLLTTDDSWATEMIAAGVATPDEAFADRRAHVITRWLAADALDIRAHHLRCELTADSRLLLCSDGVWNHIPAASALADILAPEADDDSSDGSLADAVRRGSQDLVQAALDDGGTDNATAVLVSVGRTEDDR